MAGAFVAVADDATGVYWNPAGLAAGALVTVVAEHSSGELGREGFDGDRAVGGRLGLQDATGTLVALGLPALGLSYYRLASTGFEGSLAADSPAGPGTVLITDNVAVNLLQSLAEGVHVGASLRLVHGSAGVAPVSGSDPASILDAAGDLSRRSSWAFDVDAGVFVVRGGWQVGLAARNLVRPAFETLDENVDVSQSRQVRAGVAFRPRVGTLLAVDGDLTRTDTALGPTRRLAVGVDQALGARLAVRGGVHVNTLDEARPAAALGASAAVTSSIWVDAYLTRGGDDAERRWGIGMRFAY